MDDGSGFARAVQPVSAGTIHTDAEGLEVSDVKIRVKDGEISGYSAIPHRGRHLPVILVAHEIFGVHEHIRDVCRRLAKLGYMAIAPDLFQRQGDVSHMTDHQEIMSKVVSKVPDAQVISDLEAAIDYAAYTGKADAARVGLAGFCWGGRIAWLMASESTRLKAAVAWYGRLAGPTDDLHPRQPVEAAAGLRCPVLGLYGGRDQSIPLITIDEMRSAYMAMHRNAEIIVYPDAGHAFFADYRPSYDHGSAVDAWERMVKWFGQYLGE